MQRYGHFLGNRTQRQPCRSECHQPTLKHDNLKGDGPENNLLLNEVDQILNENPDRKENPRFCHSFLVNMNATDCVEPEKRLALLRGGRAVGAARTPSLMPI